MAFLANSLERFGIDIAGVLGNEYFVVGLMFVAFLLGTFAMFKGLLRFSFKSSGQFQRKEINVIALMLSIISSAGIFFIFRSSASELIHLFGGFAGLIVVIFLMIFLMHTMYTFAEHFKDEDGAMGKGVGWIFIMSLGVVLSSYLLLGYSSKVIEGLTGTNLFTWINSAVSFIIELALLGAIVFGFIWLFKGNGSDDDSISAQHSSDDDSNGGIFGISKKKKNNRKEAGEIKEFMEEMIKGIQRADSAFRDKQKMLQKLSTLVQAQADDSSPQQNQPQQREQEGSSSEGENNGGIQNG